MDVVVRGLEVGAGVHQLAVEPQAVEVVPDVVVVADRLAVALDRVGGAGEPRGRVAVGPGVAARRRQREQLPPEREPAAQARPEVVQVGGEPQEREDVALDVEVLVDVRLPERDPVRRPEHGPDRPRVPEPDPPACRR